MHINPRDMARMMKQLGIKNEEIEDVEEVIIKTKTKTIKILPFSVQKIIIQGQTTIQIAVSNMEEIDNNNEEENKKYTEEDIKIVMEKKGVGREEAVKLLDEVDGDLVKALMN